MKKLLLILIFFLLPFFLSQPAFADTNDYETTVDSHYTVLPDGNTQVTQTIQITNKTEFVYTPSFTSTTGLDTVEDIKIFNSYSSLPFEEKDDENGSKVIKISFPDRVVGLGKTNTFTLSYTTKSIARHTGNVWEITVPGLANPDAYKNYSVNLHLPDNLGKLIAVKPQKSMIQGSDFSFQKEDIGKSGVQLLFGEEQFYKLTLTYNLENKNLFPIKTEIALPQKTNYQSVIIKKISEKPINTYTDEDGNWLALYSLNPQELKTVTVEALVKVKLNPDIQGITKEEKELYLQQKPFWERTGEIEKKAKELKTPENIYRYVVKTLQYNYGKVSEDNVRLGAKNALKNPSNSVCLEFTDLFIALARAAGIPAREVEGYAFTENTKLRPLSLVKDVLHAWPEYYDFDKKTWVMIDPTWGNTTSGIDYFHTFDFSHVAFVIKGKDSTYPVPAGGYKFDENSRDVRVSFASPSDFTDSGKSSLQIDLTSNSFSGFPITGFLTVENTSGVLVENKTILISSELSPRNQTINIGMLPPYGKKTYSLTFEKTPFLTNKVFETTIQFDGMTQKRFIRVSMFPDNLWLLIGGGTIAGCIFISHVAFNTWRLSVSRRKRQSVVRGKSKRS